MIVVVVEAAYVYWGRGKSKVGLALLSPDDSSCGGGGLCLLGEG